MKRLRPVLLAVAALAVAGCQPQAGQAARESFLSPAARAAWPHLKADAEYGIDAQIRDGVLGENAAETNRERVRLWDEAVKRLGGGS